MRRALIGKHKKYRKKEIEREEERKGGREGEEEKERRRRGGKYLLAEAATCGIKLNIMSIYLTDSAIIRSAKATRH
jgi:hypothetical protein